MKYEGYTPKNERRFRQMTKTFSAAPDVASVDRLMLLLFLPDPAFDREDILVARERAAEVKVS